MTIMLFICKRESIKVYLWGSIGLELDGSEMLRDCKSSVFVLDLQHLPLLEVQPVSYPATLTPGWHIDAHACTESPGGLTHRPSSSLHILQFRQRLQSGASTLSGCSRTSVAPRTPPVSPPARYGERQSGERRLKGGVCFFLSPPLHLHRGPNELVLITPVDTSADFKPLCFSVPLLCLSVVFLLWLVQLASCYLIELQIECPQSALALQFLFFSLQLINRRQSDFYQMMFWGAASSFVESKLGGVKLRTHSKLGMAAKWEACLYCKDIHL